MPRHEPKPPRPPTARIRPNPAAAALGVGISPDQWTPQGMIHALVNRYLQLVKIAEDAKDKSETRRQRLSMSGAFELAQFIASYHQDRGDSELFARWDRRARQASATAYRQTSPAARTLGTDVPSEQTTSDEEEEDVPS